MRSDRENATIRHIQAQWARIIRSVRARSEAIRQQTIMSGFRTFLQWWPIENYTKPRRVRARGNWDFHRGYLLPKVRHFISYNRQGQYKWGARGRRAADGTISYTRIIVKHDNTMDSNGGDMMYHSLFDRLWWFVRQNYGHMRERGTFTFPPGIRLSGPNRPDSGQRHGRQER